jgi:outer membrane receptor protein involved in Fe transport
LFAGDAGAYYKADFSTRQIYTDIMVNLHKNIDEFSFSANIGASLEDVVYKYSTFGGDLQSIPNLFVFKNVNLSKIKIDQSGYHDQGQAVFATGQIGYKKLVYLDITARNDWSTALGNTTAKSIFYPSVGLTGVLSDLLPIKSNTLSFLKARLSYSEVGNAPQRYISTTTYPVVDGYPQLTSYLPATNVQPERTKSYEAGINLILWNNKVTFDATIYKSSTYNQLFNPSLSSSSGFSSFYVNAGRIDNKGLLWELTRSWVRLIGRLT